MCDKYFSAATIWTGSNRVTRHSQRPLAHEKCRSHLKPMASHKETFGPRRQSMTFPRVTGARARFLAETDALPGAHICLEEWMDRLDGETWASFKSHAWWAFLKCNTGLIIEAPICYNINCRSHLDVFSLTERRKGSNSEGLQPTLSGCWPRRERDSGGVKGCFYWPGASTNLLEERIQE